MTETDRIQRFVVPGAALALFIALYGLYAFGPGGALPRHSLGLGRRAVRFPLPRYPQRAVRARMLAPGASMSM